ncbi:hypothetical protein [Dactylosporangium sp. NPDC048998]|uniref:hypothetical protein n=1 Tax=Dactylosporangium sp. NPDC048998 TaxID=3363976 RepID=UPI003717663D
MTTNTGSASSCISAASGGEAKFVTSSFRLRVVGTDGRYVYATDDCGIRRVDPGTGAVTSLTTTGNYASVAIAGQYLYTVNQAYGGLTRIDLVTGSSVVLDPNITGAVAADLQNV